MANVAVVDCQLAGISGDMLVAALIDVGADEAKILSAMKSAPRHLRGCKDVDVKVERIKDHGFRALRVNVLVDDPEGHRRAPEVIESLSNWLGDANLNEPAKLFALRSLETLISAEATVHGVSNDQVLLHESGNADTLADIVGAAVGLDDLHLIGADVYCTPVAVGGGLFRFSHGLVPSPAPGTLEILRAKGIPFIGGPAEAELTTPTGAALLANMVVNTTKFYPSMKPTRVGYGAGAQEFEAFPNLLRLVVGEVDGLLTQGMFVIETNVDDVSGEVLGHVVDKLIALGASDAYLFSAIGKKNRPSHMVKAIADGSKIDDLTNALINETGSLGVRVYPCTRRLVSREVSEIDVTIGGTSRTVRVKVARAGNGRSIRVKPEYEDALRIAGETGLPLREVLEEISAEARKKFVRKA